MNNNLINNIKCGFIRVLRCRVKLAWLFSLFLGVAHLAGKLFYNNLVQTDSVEFIPTAITFILLWAMYYVLLKLLYCALDSADLKAKRAQRFYSKFSEKPFLYSLITMLFFWLPHLLIKYPSGLCGDSAGQIFQNFYSYSAHHPVLHTLFLGAFIKIGIAFGSANMGLFASTTAQTLIQAFVFAYSVKVAVRKRAKDWAVWLMLAFFCLCPYVTGYVGECVKDILYVVFLYLFVVSITNWAREDEYWKSAENIIVLLFASFGTTMFRNNGKFVVIPTLLIVGVIELVSQRKKHGNGLLIKLAVLLCCCALPIVATNCINSAVNAEKGKLAEALSMPAQQTARYLRDYPDEVTDAEREKISTVLNFDELPKVYNPRISDPTKGQFRPDTKLSDLYDYMDAWISMFFKHPMCYVNATLEQNYYLFFPEYNNYTYYLGTEDCESYYELAKAYEVYIGTPEILERLMPYYSAMLDFLHTAPILSIINNMAVFDIVFVMLCAFFLSKKRYKELVILLPSFLSIGIVILAPCIKYHVRYAFPIIYTVPFIMSAYTMPSAKENDGLA